MVYIRSDIPCRRVTDYETMSVELLALEVLPRHNAKQTKWMFMNAYKPPNISNGQFTLDMSNMPDRVHANYSNICLLGDLNLDCVVESKCEPNQGLV